MSATDAALRSRHLAWVRYIIVIFIAPHASYAAPQLSSPSALHAAVYDLHDGVQITADGIVSLHADASPPPFAERDYQRYGFYTSAVQTFQAPTSRILLTYDAAVPSDGAIAVDVRASANGARWSAWETALANGATVAFPQAARMAQYRLRLFGDNGATPAVRAIGLHAVAGAAEYHALSDETAPTFKVRATRLGMVGGRTANGYVFQPRAHFVALPSWRSLSSRNGYEYQVRITYKGRSAVAPVWDVGPWNAHDDYWSLERERYQDLRRGWPQDHAAFFDKYNNGRAERGYVRFPTAIDVGDGVWLDDLKIKGDQAEVEVTFLWMGHDPNANPPPPDAKAAEFVVDEQTPAFQANNATWYHSPGGCGEGGHAYWTITTNDPANSENSARWQPTLPTERLYDVYVHVPICPNRRSPTEQARYLVQHRDGSQEVLINQAQQTSWVLLGRFPFAAGSSGFVQLTDVAGDDDRSLWFDQARWVPVP